jgi:hypothetical protein
MIIFITAIGIALAIILIHATVQAYIFLRMLVADCRAYLRRPHGKIASEKMARECEETKAYMRKRYAK